MKDDPTPIPEEEISSPDEGKNSLLRESQVRLKAPVEPVIPPRTDSPRPHLILISGGDQAHSEELGHGLDDEQGEKKRGEEKVHRRQVIEEALRTVDPSGVPPRRPTPAPAPKRPRRRWAFLIVGALLGLGVALGLAASRAALQGEARSIELAAPPGVEVRLDGAVIDGARFSVPLDGRPHTLELDPGDGRPPLRLELPAQPR